MSYFTNKVLREIYCNWDFVSQRVCFVSCLDFLRLHIFHMPETITYNNSFPEKLALEEFQVKVYTGAGRIAVYSVTVCKNWMFVSLQHLLRVQAGVWGVHAGLVPAVPGHPHRGGELPSHPRLSVRDYLTNYECLVICFVKSLWEDNLDYCPLKKFSWKLLECEHVLKEIKLSILCCQITCLTRSLLKCPKG